MRVFLCDDDPVIVKMLEHMLKKFGYEYACETELRDCSPKIRAFSPDVVVLDYWFKGIPAVEVIDNLKQDPAMESTPIILLSAVHNIQEIANELLIEDYLQKPFEMSELRNVLQKYDSTTQKPS